MKRQRCEGEEEKQQRVDENLNPIIESFKSTN